MTNYDVFISYARLDDADGKHFITNLRQALEKANLKVWMDTSALRTGEEWERQIRKGVESSDNIVFIVSVNSMNSEACQKELAYARQLKKRILPFFYESMNTVKPSLGGLFLKPFAVIASENWQYIDKNQRDQTYPITKDFKAAISNLTSDIRQNPECRQFQTELTQQMVFWDSTGHSTGALLRDETLVRAERLQNECHDVIELSDEHHLFIVESRRVEDQRKQEEADRLALIKRARWQIRRLHRIQILTIMLIPMVLGLLAISIQELSVTGFHRRIAEAVNQRVVASNSSLIGDFHTAETGYQAALETLNPDHQPWIVFTARRYTEPGSGVSIAQWLRDLGYVCAQQNQWICAEDNLSQAVALADSEYQVPSQTLARVYIQNDQLDQASSLLTSLDNNLNKNPFVLAQLHASFDYASGQYQGALDLLKSSLSALPSIIRHDAALASPDVNIGSAYYLDILYYAARSYEGLNQHDNACKVWHDFQNTRLLYPPSIPILWLNDKYAQASTALASCP